MAQPQCFFLPGAATDLVQLKLTFDTYFVHMHRGQPGVDCTLFKSPQAEAWIPAMSVEGLYCLACKLPNKTLESPVVIAECVDFQRYFLYFFIIEL